MKVNFERMEELGLYKPPKAEPSYSDILFKNLRRVHLPEFHFDWGSMPRWAREGLVVSMSMSVLCGAGALGFRALGPPGRGGPSRENGIMVASNMDVSYVGAQNSQDVTVKTLSMEGRASDVFNEATAEPVTAGMAVTQMQTEEIQEVLSDMGSGGAMGEQVPEEEPASEEQVTGDSVSEADETGPETNDEPNNSDPESEPDESDDGNSESDKTDSESDKSDDGNSESDGTDGESDESDEDDDETNNKSDESDDKSDDESDDESDDGSDDESDDKTDNKTDNPEKDSEKNEDKETEPEPEIVVADVKNQLNVRTEPSTDAELAGVLYKDCGGTVLEQKDGWTKIESGELTGWVYDDYLLTGDEAVKVAEETGTKTAVVETANLRVREEPGTGDVIGHLSEGDEYEVLDTVEDNDTEWFEIQFGDRTAYVSTDYVTMTVQVNTGKTVDELKAEAEAKQKEAAEASKKKATTNEAELTVTAAYDGTDSDLEMLAAIIYCESGNQPYEGKVAVGNVVLNRVASASFPSDINSVIRAPRQFSPVRSGKYDRVLSSGHIPESCYEAAQDAMNGISFVGDCLYFKNPKIAGAHSGTTIGDHVFW